MNKLLNPTPPSDQRLIELHLTGDETAFRQIVERYQGMVCALAYCASGDVARSEDIAQEVFIAAWRQLAQLREPVKLRGWLCGITRNLAHNSIRREGRTPTEHANEFLPDASSEEAGPREQAIGADEAALMWCALGGLPQSYREPMVLFYREGHSIAAVAATLELSEETVRQRLARGRAMLTGRMAKLVEEALGRSAPTRAFAGAVIIALPAGPIAVEVAVSGGGAAGKSLVAAGTLSSAAMKGGVVFKFFAAMAFLPALLQGMEDFIRFNDRNTAEGDAVVRRQAAWTYFEMNAGIGLFILGFLVIPKFSSRPSSPWIFGLIGLCAVAGIWTSLRANCRMKRQKDIHIAPPNELRGFERRSAKGFLGLPYYHIRLGTRPTRSAPVVRGWIAVSDSRAVGGLFAFGNMVALAPVSMGVLSVGVFSIGALAIGVGALGVAVAGWWSTGLLAAGGFAAKGIWAVAPQFTSRVSTYAVHAGDAVAQSFFHTHWFYRFTSMSTGILLWAGLLGWVMPVVLTGWQLWRTRRAG